MWRFEILHLVLAVLATVRICRSTGHVSAIAAWNSSPGRFSCITFLYVESPGRGRGSTDALDQDGVADSPLD
ncbi:hypothetical protein M758_8G067600 [Ceratodon purpureus]|nr:hypothetical protein M758_8G067600 [Ceratodon purpureus]